MVPGYVRPPFLFDTVHRRDCRRQDRLCSDGLCQRLWLASVSIFSLGSIQILIISALGIQCDYVNVMGKTNVGLWIPAIYGTLTDVNNKGKTPGQILDDSQGELALTCLPLS